MTAMKSTTRRKVVRRIVAVAVLVLTSVGIVAGVNHLEQRNAASGAAAEASPPKTATVTRGDLSSTERIDGSVQLVSTRTVIHRIEGQTRGTSSAAGATGGGANTNVDTDGGAASSGSLGGLSSDSASAAMSLISQRPKLDFEGAAAIGSNEGTQATDVQTTMPPASDATPTTDTNTTAPPLTEPATTAPASSVPPSTMPPSTAPDTTAPDTTAPDTTGPGVTMPGPTVPDSTSPGSTIGRPPGSGGAPGGAPGGAVGGNAPSTGSSSGGDSTSGAATTERVTSVSPVGTRIDLGMTLYTVDNKPVEALAGIVPAWRTMSTSSEDGVDIRQLEQSLTDLGYDPDSTMTIDAEFDSDTNNVVKAWQEGVGLEVTGSVTFGSVVFLIPGTEVTDVHVNVGDSIGDGDNVVTIAAATQQVVIDVPEELQRLVTVGLPVDIEGIEGTVTLLRSTERDGAVVVQALIAPNAELAVTAGSTVGVRISVTTHRRALLVPALAVASRIDGSYAVRVISADETTRWESVRVIGVGGTSVAIESAGINEGDTIQVPE